MRKLEDVEIEFITTTNQIKCYRLYIWEHSADGGEQIGKMARVETWTREYRNFGEGAIFKTKTLRKFTEESLSPIRQRLNRGIIQYNWTNLG